MSGKYDPIRLQALGAFAEAEVAAQIYGEKSDIAQDKYDIARAYAVTAAERAVKTDVERGMLDCDSGMGALQDTPLEAVFRSAYTETVKLQSPTSLANLRTEIRMNHGDDHLDFDVSELHGTPEFENWYVTKNATSLAHAAELRASFRKYNYADGTYRDMSLNMAYCDYKKN